MGLYKFRRELIESFLVEGNDVHVSVPKDSYFSKLEEMGCRCIETFVDRRGANPLADFRLLRFYMRTVQEITPDCVLTYTIKPNIFGGIACTLLKIPYISNVTGLGTPIENRGFLGAISLLLYRIGLSNASCVFFQNRSNKDFFEKKGVVLRKTKVIPGSGVNVNQYSALPYPGLEAPVTFLFIGRIMKEKGVGELLEAAERVKKLHKDTSFELVGGAEEGYMAEIRKAEEKGIVRYHGEQENVRPFIENSHAVVLPSYHEGMSNVLLEAASSARPVFASRVAGCVETFDEGVSGYGFAPRNVEQLVEVLCRFILLPHGEKIKMGERGRAKIEKEFNRAVVIAAYHAEIRTLETNL